MILIRHAATESNLQRPAVLQGRHADHPLAEMGERQARSLAAALSSRSIAAVFSSPLRRAVQTAAPIAEHRRLNVETSDALTEVDVGAWEGMTWPDVAQSWPEEYRAFLADPEQHGYLGGENLDQVRRRCVPALENLAAKARGATLVVVGHNTVNRVVLAHWLDLPLTYARRLPQANAAYNEIVFSNGSVHVRTINRLDHLAEILSE
jgi:broad specificity phosphatase PhoE